MHGKKVDTTQGIDYSKTKQKEMIAAQQKEEEESTDCLNCGS